MDELDPIQRADLALLRAEHQKRFQVMIAYLKEKVGEGIEYTNPVVRVVVSEQGAYYELNDLPEDFAGVAGPEVERRFVDNTEAIALLRQCVQVIADITAENTRQFSLLVLYTRRGIIDRKNCYIYAVQRDAWGKLGFPLEIGTFQPEVMPLFFKIRVDTELLASALGFPRGLCFCMANAGDRNLLISAPLTGENLTDLSNLPQADTMQ